MKHQFELYNMENSLNKINLLVEWLALINSMYPL